MLADSKKIERTKQKHKTSKKKRKNTIHSLSMFYILCFCFWTFAILILFPIRVYVLFYFVLLFVLPCPVMCFRRVLFVFVSDLFVSFSYGFWVSLLACVFLSWVSGFLFSSFVSLFP